MPEFGRTRRGSPVARLRRRLASAAPPVLAAAAFAVAATPAPAQIVRLSEDGRFRVDSLEIAWFSAMVGAIFFAVLSAAMLIRSRTRAEQERDRLLREAADLKAAADRAEAVLAADDQRVVIWNGGGDQPLVMGSLPEGSGVPKSRSAFLAFGQWLEPAATQALEDRIRALRSGGEAFTEILRSGAGTHVEATGRVSGAGYFVRFRNISRERLQYVELADRHERQSRELATLHGLLEALPMPMWMRDRGGRLIFANRAYARAVEAPDPAQAVGSQLELLDAAGRQQVLDSRASGDVFSRRLSVVVAGSRRVFDVVDAATGEASAGLASDVSELERVQAQLRRTLQSHAGTLNQLATAVAIFGADRRLQFYNAAYAGLFGLDTAFMESHPEDGAVLDQLRAMRKLPEEADYRDWKAKMLSSYQEVESRESWWHLPGGQTLRVIASPHPQGGVTYVYENVTERLDLQSRYNSLIRVQGETLDHLAEGVAVFGSDGLLRLFNPAFASLWRLDEAVLRERPHIAEVLRRCRVSRGDDPAWEEIRTAVTGLADSRTRLGGRLDGPDGAVVDYGTVPLPDGATLVTFVNVTDTVNVERALVEKNEALEAADRLKNRFIQLVSYELRSPLTNIIGFAQLLADESAGPLSGKQREYTGYIMDSSAALLAIINDILDLATLDAGIMELDLTEIDVAETVEAAVAGLRDRLAEARISLVDRVPRDIGGFVADEKRVRQVLFNLLSNAIAFTPDGGAVEVDCRREDGDVVFEVRDHGRGIPEDYLDAVFERFEGRSSGARRRGAGLGLSIVKSFVELHGGKVEITSREGEGTTVRCRFPGEGGVTAAAE